MASQVTFPGQSIAFHHVVWRWQGYGGFEFNSSPAGLFGKQAFEGAHPPGLNSNFQSVLIPIDPLTAISLGLVTPEELNYPPGILAAFNLLKGH